MDKVNDISINAPESLDKVFFANALQNGLREQRIDIRRFKFLSKSGDSEKHNCSEIYRVLLLYAKTGQLNPDAINVIVKVTPSPEGLDLLETSHVFNKEKWLLLEILPQFEILLNDIKFAPKCYYATNNPLQALVLEDMDRFGFQMANRETGLDERHTKFSLNKLGQFHGVSIVFAKKRPSMMTEYERGLLDPKVIHPSTSFYKMLYKNLCYVIKMASEWEGFEQITKKLQAFQNDFESRLLACQKSKNGEIKVLNHGDFAVNNLLFKYDPRNNPVDLVFIDFQLSIYGSLGIDLNYFLFASVQLEVLEKWKGLLEIYHASLRATLVELSYSDIPTLAQIEKEFKQKSANGLFALIGPLTIMTMKGNSFEKLAGSNVQTKVIFSNRVFIERLKYSLLELDKLGAF